MKSIKFTIEEIMKLEAPIMPKTKEEFRKIYPISSSIDELYWNYFLSETKDETIRTKILEKVDSLEKLYREGARKELDSDVDWITIEVFPGAKIFYSKYFGTKDESQTIGHTHYFIRFMQIEEKLLTK